jgi:hypothetical protein
VIGRHFSRNAIAALLGRNGPELDARLESLRRNELIEHDTGWFLGEPVMRFHHVLIRDAAYRRLLKGTRAELHEQLADWIEHQVNDASEHDETIGWHLEQSYRHLRELGPVDDHGTALGERAARRLATAGRRALARDDIRLAAVVLGRALACLGEDDAARADLALDWCEALLAAGDVEPSLAALAEIERFAGGSPRLRAWHTCFAGQLAVLTAPEELHAVAERVAVAARELSAQGDAAGEAKAHFVHSQALARLGKVGACEAALDMALAAARRAGDRRRANAVLAGAPLAALWGPSPVTRASGRCLDVVRVLRITQGAPAVEAVALSCQGVLEALRGRSDAGRRMLATSRAMVEELGITQRLFEVDVFIGRVELLEGDAAAAERVLRPAYDGLRTLGLGIDAARAAALLARALLALGRNTEAEALSHESEALAGDDLQAAIAWRGVRAEALAARGEHATAVELATAAVGIAAATDALLDHADARVALAAALAGAGRDATPERRRAADLWEAKGATLLGERAWGGPPRGPAQAAEALTADTTPARPRRRVRASAATRAVERFAETILARDGDQLRQLFTDDLQIVHHPTGATYGRREMLGTWRSIFKAERLAYRHEVLAALGERLALSRHVISLEGLTEQHLASFGSAEVDEVGVFEVDAQGHVEAIEIFAPDRLRSALARLYERWGESLPEGAARTRAVTIARTVASWSLPFDSEAFLGSPIAATFRSVDHRILGTWTAPGPEQWKAHLRTQASLTDGFAMRDDDVLALEPDGLVARQTFFGIDRGSGETFENVVITSCVFGDDGLFVRGDTFEPDRAAEAVEHFERLTAPAVAHVPFANAAARVGDRLTETWLARDWEAHGQLFATEFSHVDRRRMVQLELDRDQWLEFTPRVGDRATTRNVCEAIATRGDRLLLIRQRIEVADGAVGASEIASLILTEIDTAGLVVRVVRWDEDDLEAAHAELDACYQAGEGTTHPAHAAVMRAFAGAVASGDWTPVIALCAPSFVEHDHRHLAVLGTTHGAEAWARNFSALTDLAPDTIYRSDHFRSVARAFLSVGTWVGSRDGGHYEIPLVAVLETDAGDRLVRADIYDLDQHDDAQARFTALRDRAMSIPV